MSCISYNLIFYYSPLDLPTGYIFYLPKFLLIRLFFKSIEYSQHLLGLFSRSFCHMKCICVNFLDLDLFFQFLKGLCHGNQFGQNLRNDLYSTRRHFETDSIIAISMQKYSMVIFSLHTMQIWSRLVQYNPREIANYAVIWRSSFICHLASGNGLENHNSDLCMLIGNQLCTLCENLVRFGSVTPEF